MVRCRERGGKVRVIDEGLDRSLAFFLDVTVVNLCFMRLNLEP